MPGLGITKNISCSLSLLPCPNCEALTDQFESSALIDSEMVKPMEVDNCVENWNEVMMPGPDECRNEEARVSENIGGESSNREKALDREDSDDSDGIPILPFKGIQKLVNCLLFVLV